MTNIFQVVMWVMWSTNQMDVLLTPSGDDIVRHFIAVQHHVYNLPGYPTVTNSVPVATNSIHMKWGWTQVTNDLPPVPDQSRFTTPEYLRSVVRGTITNNAYTIKPDDGWSPGPPSYQRITTEPK